MISYLAYGSSMSTRRFSEPLGWSEQDFSRFVTVSMPQKCEILGFTVVFNRLDDTTMTGQANLMPAQAPKSESVVYQLTNDQLEFLDRSEAGYTRRKVSVSLEGGKTIVEAQAYIALQTSDDLKPSRDYLQTVIDAAREHQLGSEYITCLEQTPIEPAADAVKAIEQQLRNPLASD